MAVNFSSSFSLKSLNQNLNQLSNLFNQLASGSRITKAADDAAGSAVASALNADAVVSDVGARNAGDAISATNIADSAMSQIGNIATRMQELAAEASNGTYSDQQRAALQNEYSQLGQEAQRIASTTEFNGNQLLQGGGFTAQVGSGSGSESRVNVPNADLASMISSVTSTNISTQASAQNAMNAVNNFSSALSSAQGSYGSSQARLEQAGSLASSRALTDRSASSRITDLDMAKGVADMTAANIRAQAGTAFLAQANKLSGDTVLRLLK